MNKLVQLYRLLNTLSIDVALGAACCAAWFANVFHVQLRPYALLALGFTVWIIYTADHLMDALKIRKEASTERHRFHQLYFKILLVCLIIAVVIDFSLLFFIRAKILHTGFVLFAIVILYLLVNRWLSFAKEIVIACVYCTGVLLPALALRVDGLSFFEFLLIAIFFLTALINLILFSLYDIRADQLDGYDSFVLRFGVSGTRKILIILFAVQFVLLATLFSTTAWSYAVLFLAMNGVLFLLFIMPLHFQKNDMYRLSGDVIFLFPVVFLLIG